MTREQRMALGIGRTVGTIVGAAVLAGVLSGVGQGAWAQDRGAQPAQVSEGTGDKAPSELAREALEKMMQALDKLIASMPQYEAPIITEDGDIIIRRKRPNTAPPPRKVPPV